MYTKLPFHTRLRTYRLSGRSTLTGSFVRSFSREPWQNHARCWLVEARIPASDLQPCSHGAYAFLFLTPCRSFSHDALLYSLHIQTSQPSAASTRCIQSRFGPNSRAHFESSLAVVSNRYHHNHAPAQRSYTAFRELLLRRPNPSLCDPFPYMG